MSVKPNKAPAKDDKSDAKDAHKDAKADKPEREAFVNEPSSLDETTHRELQLMHNEAAEAILFAKSIQWRSVGASLVVFGSFIAIAVATEAGPKFIDLMKIAAIVLTCGVMFVLVMYQFWQVNEINKLNAIGRQFSTLYQRISRIKSRREGNFHRYTILLFMVICVVLGLTVAMFGMDQVSQLHKPPGY
jgi:hypothetical protein